TRYDACLVRDRVVLLPVFFFSSRRRHTRFSRDWSSDVCSSDLGTVVVIAQPDAGHHAGGIADEDGVARLLAGAGLAGEGPTVERSEERRVGKECRRRGSR